MKSPVAAQKLDQEKLKDYVNEHPDAYLKEIGEVFDCSGTSVQKVFRRLTIMRKKRRNDTTNRNLHK